jgi:hypothetical protein
MLRCAASFVTAAYVKVRLIPQDLRALPLAFLRSRHGWHVLLISCGGVRILTILKQAVLW